MRGDDEAEGWRAGPEPIQSIMCGLQARFAAVQSLCVTDGNSNSHLGYPSAIGMVKWKVVPFLYSLSNQMRPPCISTRLLVMFNPNPVPGTSRAFVSSERKNFWKTFA